MLFNSLEFLIFLPTVFLLYWFIFQKNLRAQNLLLLISSYVFYGWWDYRFLSLIFLSTVVDYFVGLKIYDSNDSKAKKSYLWVSILFNLGLLGFFKYFNFFIDSWIDLLGAMGYEQKSTWTLNVILPVGISFYTFQTMSYSLDIYQGKLKPTKDFISFASFVSFFPQLVAGPIERAANLLPQILNERKFILKNILRGTSLIIYGFFMKIIVADNLSLISNSVFSNEDLENTSLEVLVGIYAFAFQIYGDFNGYSSIAIGTAYLFGFNLMTNFKLPYFSESPSDFWKRWHVSLSSWLRDYLYISLGGNRYGTLLTYRNLMLTMVLGGLWHGAAWNFVFWGVFHGFILCIYKLISIKNFIKSKIFRVLIMFHLTCISWVLFRCESINHIFHIFQKLLSNFSISDHGIGSMALLLFFTLPLLIFELLMYNKIDNKKINFTFFLYIILMLLFFSPITSNEFIYFQF